MQKHGNSQSPKNKEELWRYMRKRCIRICAPRIFKPRHFMHYIYRKHFELQQKKTDNFPPQLIDTMEHDFSFEKCKDLAVFTENYIRMVLPYAPYDLSSKKSSLIENIKNYIQENTYAQNNISKIADTFHYNAKYIGQLFKKETGVGLNEYVNILRLEQAKILLSESDKTILSIAFEVGYNSISYFNRVFKSHFSVTPKEYRKTAKRFD